jgi:hypothetical protein
MDLLMPPGVEPTFFPDTEVGPDEWKYYSSEQTTCVFCQRDRHQVPRLIINGAVNGGDVRSVCSECVEELSVVLRGADAYEAWCEERRRRFAEEIGESPYPPSPDLRPEWK